MEIDDNRILETFLENIQSYKNFGAATAMASTINGVIEWVEASSKEIFCLSNNNYDFLQDVELLDLPPAVPKITTIFEREDSMINIRRFSNEQRKEAVFSPIKIDKI